MWVALGWEDIALVLELLTATLSDMRNVLEFHRTFLPEPRNSSSRPAVRRESGTARSVFRRRGDAREQGSRAEESTTSSRK